MIIFVKNNSGSQPIEGFNLWCEALINIFKRHFLIPRNVLTDFRNTQATFVVSLFLAIQLANLGIYKYLFQSGLIRVLSFVLLILICKYLGTVYNK